MEPVVDTHGTILQTLAMPSVGFKQDWGVSMKGNLTRWDYALALQMGSGMSIHREDGNFLAAARLGSPSGQNVEYGLSLLYGHVLASMGMRTFPRNRLLSDRAVEKQMIGFNGQYLYGPFLLKGEALYGMNDHHRTVGYLLESDFIVPEHQNCQIDIQFWSLISDIEHAGREPAALIFGPSYRLNESSTVRAALWRDFDFAGHGGETKGLIQIYYYGN
jgi:hypothetical protein